MLLCTSCLRNLFLDLKEKKKICMSVVSVQFISVAVVSDSLRPYELQQARPPCPPVTPGACSNSCPLSQWCHPTISSSVAPFSSCLQPFPVSGSFPVSQFFASGGQSIGVSASASVLPKNIQVCVCVCVCMTNHCAVHLKLTGYCKLIILQFLKMKKKSSPCICEFSVCSCNLMWVNSFNCAFYFKTLFYHGPYWLFTYHSIPAFMCKAQKPWNIRVR